MDNDEVVRSLRAQLSELREHRQLLLEQRGLERLRKMRRAALRDGFVLAGQRDETIPIADVLNDVVLAIADEIDARAQSLRLLADRMAAAAARLRKQAAYHTFSGLAGLVSFAPVVPTIMSWIAGLLGLDCSATWVC